jgi:hypothetical protein
MEVPEFSGDDVRRAVGEIGEFLASDGVVTALREVGADEQLWARVSPLPRDYLGRRKVSLPEGFEIVFEGKWPGRKCFKICRSVDPVPPPPDPTGITICVELCLPG